ncbi:hypothetical protein AFGD_001066 [Aspergillus flavus]|nr:hypothetical protein AFGD_001066 [Aspergillus flavus]
MEDRLPFVTPHGTLSLATDREISPDWIKRIWYNWLIGFGYSSRKFTMMEDRLIAIAGIARSLYERTGIPYIAGLWTKNLGFGLGWLEAPNDGTEDPSRLSNRPYARRRPTWTWASTDQEFQYSLDDFEEDSGLYYVDSRIKTLGDVDDPFTIITGGWLKIRGRVYRGSDSYFTELHLGMSQEMVPFATERSQLESSVFNWNGARSQPYYIRLGQFSARPTYRTVVVRESWLIVRRVEVEEEEEKEYERLGIAYRTHTSSLDEQWDEEEEESTCEFRIMDLKLV